MNSPRSSSVGIESLLSSAAIGTVLTLVLRCAQEAQPIQLSAGVEQPTDLTGQMTAALVGGSLALYSYGRMSGPEVAENMVIAKRLFNVTMETEGVLKHYRSLWTSDSFYDDQLWAVCPMLPPLAPSA
jgi:hypothetical protein